MNCGEIVPVKQNELTDFVNKLVLELKTDNSGRAVVLALTGDLGAGKTTLVKALAELLGVKDVVTSPTFVVMKNYQTDDQVFNKLTHIDAYRIEDIAEMEPLQFSTVLSEVGNLVCIEWPEKIANLLDFPVHHLSIKNIDEDTRAITYEKKSQF